MIKLLIILTLFCICLSFLSTKKFVNLKIMAYSLMSLVGIGIIFFAIYLLRIMNLVVSNIVIYLLIFVLCFILLLINLLLTKDYVLCFIKIIDYYIHKKSLKKAYHDVGTIIDIKTLKFSKKDYVYYLIVNFKGKKIRSLCFFDNIYSIGDSIDIIVYKNHNYVILKN